MAGRGRPVAASTSREEAARPPTRLETDLRPSRSSHFPRRRAPGRQCWAGSVLRRAEIAPIPARPVLATKPGIRLVASAAGLAPELAVAGVAQSRHNVAHLVQAFIKGGEDEGDLGECLPEAF